MVGSVGAGGAYQGSRDPRSARAGPSPRQSVLESKPHQLSSPLLVTVLVLLYTDDLASHPAWIAIMA